MPVVIFAEIASRHHVSVNGVYRLGKIELKCCEFSLKCTSNLSIVWSSLDSLPEPPGLKTTHQISQLMFSSN